MSVPRPMTTCIAWYNSMDIRRMGYKELRTKAISELPKGALSRGVGALQISVVGILLFEAYLAACFRWRMQHDRMSFRLSVVFCLFVFSTESSGTLHTGRRSVWKPGGLLYCVGKQVPVDSVAQLHAHTGTRDRRMILHSMRVEAGTQCRDRPRGRCNAKCPPLFHLFFSSPKGMPSF